VRRAVIAHPTCQIAGLPWSAVCEVDYGFIFEDAGRERGEEGVDCGVVEDAEDG
jgi:hypothetical protein